MAAWLNGCLSLSPTEGIVTPENEKKKKRRRRSDDSSSSSEEDEETPLKRIGQDTLAKSDASGANAYALVFEVHLAEPRHFTVSEPASYRKCQPRMLIPYPVPTRGGRPDARSDAHVTRQVVRLAEGGLRVELSRYLPRVVETVPRQV